MMLPEFPYIFKSSVLLSVLLGYYWFFLRKQTFFNLNRIYLLGALLLSVCIPFIHITLNFTDPTMQISKTPVYYVSALMEEVYVWGNQPQTLSLRDLLYTHLSWIYAIGIGIFSLRFVIRFVRIFHLAYTYPRKRIRGVHIIFLPSSAPTFSFFNYLFLAISSLPADSKHKIFEHEKIHMRQLHSADLLVCELICIFNWFNPLVWVYKSIIAQNHEYIADNQVIRKYQTGSYLQLLINQAFRGHFVPFTNCFACSNLKKRIMMMTQKQTQKYRIFTYIPGILFGGILSVGFTCMADPLPAIAQAETLPAIFTVENSITVAAPDRDSTELIFSVVEKVPRFNGNQNYWIDKHIKYPASAREAKVEGKTDVGFVVEKDGKLTQIKLHRSSGNKALDDEAVRVVKLMPNWIPGEQGGQKVRVYYTIPVYFFLQAPPPPPAPSSVAPKKDGNVFSIVEKMPRFKGDLSKWLKENLKYPAEAQANKQQGKVYAKFIILKDGSVSDIAIARSSGSKALDDEAMRAIKAMPKWIPGEHKGAPVDVSYTLPINFNQK